MNGTQEREVVHLWRFYGSGIDIQIKKGGLDWWDGGGRPLKSACGRASIEEWDEKKLPLRTLNRVGGKGETGTMGLRGLKA